MTCGLAGNVTGQQAAAGGLQVHPAVRSLTSCAQITAGRGLEVRLDSGDGKGKGLFVVPL